MIIYTRSYNSELFSMMKEFIPECVEIKQMKGYDTWEGALTFIADVIKDCNGWAVIMDEDCFSYRFESIPAMIEYMKENGYTHAGMPDRGVSPHRTLQWTTLNPFFNIINCPEIIRLGGLDKTDMPVFMGCPTFEIFDELYLQMWKVGKPLYLNASTTMDGYTTHLKDHKGEYFALHSWLSREWVNGEKLRIMNVYNTAKVYATK
jgi:hypothetical protein